MEIEECDIHETWAVYKIGNGESLYEFSVSFQREFREDCISSGWNVNHDTLKIDSIKHSSYFLECSVIGIKKTKEELISEIGLETFEDMLIEIANHLEENYV